MKRAHDVVLGKGRSGVAAAALLRGEGHEVVLLDGEDAWPEGECGLCVTSPGIPLDHPWQVTARARGVKVISELQLGASRWRGHMIAVTGSKGKSSVVKLIADTLNLAGVPAVPCGNFGTPLCEVVLSQGSEASCGSLRPWAVVEVSSFQMETTDDFHPDAAAILNLQEDHLDRHGSVAAYHALKRKMLADARRKISFEDFPDACSHRDMALLRGSYFDNAILAVNGLIAVALMREAGLDDTRIAEGFASFKPLPHRMQLVAEINGVRYVDDSKATSLAALAAGVDMCRGPVRLIAGGLPKGDDPKIVIQHLHSRVKKVYLIGRCADQLLEAWQNDVPCESCGTLDRAVEMARRDAVVGETVLLSPGAASFDQFSSYGARGDLFASLVRREEGVDAETKKRG